MSLSDRIAQQVDKPAGCRTCAFYDALPPVDKAAFDEWVADGRPVEALRRLCVTEGLEVTETPFRSHVAEHHGRRS
jgi:hypothetical protein